MLTSFAWVPHGAMRQTPLHTNDTMEQVRNKLMRQNPDFIGGGEGDDEPTDLSAQQQQTAKKTKKGSLKKGATDAKKKKKKARDDDDDAVEDESDVDEDNIFHRFGGNVVEELISDDEDEQEDANFKATDLVFVVSRADEEEPRFELFIYDDPEDAMYVHHDANVSAYPLASTWLSDGQLSMLAIGTMLPFIEIWPLDVIDAVEPAVLLGGCVSAEDNYRRRKVKKSLLKPDSHQDAVLSLDWNTNAQHILASGSADDTIKIWDLNTQTAIGTYAEGCKIQSLMFHPTEENLLLSGGFDGNVVVRDCRAPQQPAMRWNVSDVVERVEWSVHTPTLVASTSGGLVGSFEARMNAPAPVWYVQAHDCDATFSLSRHIPGLLATGGKDGNLTLWDVREQALRTHQQVPVSGGNGGMGGGLLQPSPIVSKNHNAGSLLSIRFHPNVPTVLGAGGTRGEPLIYTITEDIKKAFPMVK